MFFKYPSIDNLNNLKRYFTKCYGISAGVDVNITGTVKIHGTNAGVTVSRTGDIYYQSRNRLISVENDNAGFAQFADSNKDYFLNLVQDIGFNDFDYVTIYGEWCGANIQKGVGVSGMDKAFVIFGVKRSSVIDENDRESDISEVADFSNIITDSEHRIFSILDFPVYEEKLNIFDQSSIDRLNEITLAVEDECPVAKELNPGGVMIGEGVVWSGELNGKPFKFKHKGDKHARGSGSKKVSAGSGFTPDQVEAFNGFCKVALTNDRLAQGIEHFNEMNIEVVAQNTGKYIKWVNEDVLKECRQEIDLLEHNHGIAWKSIVKQVTNAAKQYYMSQ